MVIAMYEMETTAPSATADGGYGVNAIRNDGETVLGKGKVDGSIPFGSTIGNPRKSADFLGSRPLPKDILPGSETGPDDPVERFIASGGRITYCPPAYVGVVNGGTRLTGSDIKMETWVEGNSRMYAHKNAAPRKANKGSYKTGGVNRGVLASMAKHAARLEKLRALHASGMSIESMANSEGVRMNRMRELLRKAGVL